MNLNSLSALPETDKAELLHSAYKIKLISSLIKLISYVASTLAEDYSSVLIKLNNIKNNLPKFISPRLYSLYFKLLAAINKDDIAKVRETISILENMDENLYSINQRIIKRGLSEAWEHDVFVDEVKVAFGTDQLMATLPHKYEVDALQADINTTLHLIASADPIFFTEINSLVAIVQLVKSDANVGATSPKFFGSLYISLPQGNAKNHPILYFTEHLVHETSHLYLNTIIPNDPLVLNDARDCFASPIRLDLRPMLGIYHAAFVLSRVIRIFRKINIFNLYHDHHLVKVCVSSLTEKYEIAYKTVATQGILTSVGRKILESTRECAFL